MRWSQPGRGAAIEAGRPGGGWKRGWGRYLFLTLERSFSVVSTPFVESKSSLVVTFFDIYKMCIFLRPVGIFRDGGFSTKSWDSKDASLLYTAVGTSRKNTITERSNEKFSKLMTRNPNRHLLV